MRMRKKKHEVIAKTVVAFKTKSFDMVETVASVGDRGGISTYAMNLSNVCLSGAVIVTPRHKHEGADDYKLLSIE
jgi:hypothetical protein